MTYKISFNGRTYLVEVEVREPQTMEEYTKYAPAAPAAPIAAVPAAAPAAESAPAAPAAAPVVGSGEPINAPMPGTILKVNVQNGLAVKKGDVLVVLEAMKMENEILAPRDCTINQVLVTKGATVDSGAPLVVIG